MAPPTTEIKKLGARLVLHSFDAMPDEEGIHPACFYSDSRSKLFYQNRTQGSSGLLPANPETLDYVMPNGKSWRTEAELVRTVNMTTISLDDYCKANNLWPDFLSMDIQGAERDVLLGGAITLRSVLAIVTEVEFRPLYEDQALFADIDKLLRPQGFQFMALYSTQYWQLHAKDAQKVLTVGEALYLRRPVGLEDRALEKLSAIASCFDLAGYVH